MKNSKWPAMLQGHRESICRNAGRPETFRRAEEPLIESEVSAVQGCTAEIDNRAAYWIL